MSKEETTASLTVNPPRGIDTMLSRKEFFKDLLFRGIRTVNDLAEPVDKAPTEPLAVVAGFDLPATELSPSLLAIEAELRGVRLQAGDAENLQREIYQELTQKRPPIRPEEPR